MRSDNVLATGVYDPNFSLYGSFWNLAQRIQIIGDAELSRILANIVVKYFYAILSPDSVHKKVPESSINQAFTAVRIHNEKERGFIEPEIAHSVLGTNRYISPELEHMGYQLRMLGDVSSTITIMKHIINTTLQENSSEFHGLDLGSGTGIMLLALYLQSVLQKRQIQTNCGIEISSKIGARANDIVGRLGIGEVRTANTCDSNVLLEACYAIPSMVVNENIPSWGCGSTNCDSPQEPYFHNIFSLQGAYGPDAFAHMKHFPAKVGILYWKDGVYVYSKGGRLCGAISGRKTYVTCGPHDVIAFDSKTIFDIERGSFMTIKPTEDTGVIHTCNVGNEHMGTLVMPARYGGLRWGISLDEGCDFRIPCLTREKNNKTL